MKTKYPLATLAAIIGMLVHFWASSILADDCLRPVGRWPYGLSMAVAVSGAYAYMGSGRALLVVDVSDPGVP